MSYRHIRWMIRRDMPEVLEIENHSFAFPWTEDDFISCLRQRNFIGMVAELPRIEDEANPPIAGFMIYVLHKARLELFNLAVHPKYRRTGIGRSLLERLVGKLSPQRRNSITFVIRESNIAGQHFLSACGFKATTIIMRRWLFPRSDDRFEYRIAAMEYSG